MASETLLYFPLNIHINGMTSRAYAPMRPIPVPEDTGLTAYVLIATVGSLHQGLYVLNGSCWRFALPQPLLSELLIGGGVLDLYLGLSAPITVDDRSIVYKNGILFNETTLDGPSIYCVIVPPVIPPPPIPTPDPTFIAARDLSGHRVIKITVDGADYASSATVGDAHRVLGISMGAALQGSAVTVQTEGEMTEPSWNWDIEQPVFIGIDGALTQVSATTGYSLIVGIPVTSTTILVAVKQPIIII
jgi:hypothetical protein